MVAATVGGTAGTGVSIIVPSFNEASLLPTTLGRLREAFPAAELVLASDGCTDDTPAVVTSLPFPVTFLRHTPNRGKGCSIRRGMLNAQGEYLVFTDADLPFGTAGVATVIERLQAADRPDIVIAMKAGEKKGIGYRSARQVVRLAVKGLLGLRYADTQAGLKGFRREPAQGVFAQTHIDRFATDLEMLYIAEQRGYRIAALELLLDPAVDRPSSFTPKQGLLLLGDIWKIRRTDYR